MLFTASAFPHEMLFLCLKDVSIYFTSITIYFVSYHTLWVGTQTGRRGRRRDNMCEKAKDNANQINNLKNFSGHKFVWEQLWGLVTQSWIWGGPEKKNISTFFSCNLYIFNFIFFLVPSFWQHNYFLQLACELDLSTQLDSGSHIRGIVKWNVIMCQWVGVSLRESDGA